MLDRLENGSVEPVRLLQEAIMGPWLAGVLGAIVGSFLNAVIHRLPRGIKLGEPRRSFCPGCNRPVPWHRNIPLLSWPLLRGRCAVCEWRIPLRYWIVELLTTALFAGMAILHGWPAAPVYWLFCSLLVAATFIDLEHFIIPDEITWGGAACGVAASLVYPGLMGVQSPVEALLHSLGGAALGFGVVLAIVELGKLAFGRITHTFEPAESFSIDASGAEPVLEIAGEVLPWAELFARAKDEIRIEPVGAVRIDESEFESREVVFRYGECRLNGSVLPLGDFRKAEGRCSRITLPREAMGFGDVKFMACLGAFLGWQSIVFILFFASITGALAGVAGLALARDRAGVRIPFGPFLAAGALAWILGGSDLAAWYLGGGWMH